MSEGIERKMRIGGFGLLEVVVGAAVLTSVVLAVAVVFGNLVRASSLSLRSTQATFLLQEGAEVLRLWRDRGWANIKELTPGTPYYFNFTGADWATSTTPVLVGGLFERTFTAALVYRDAVSGDIVPSGTLDPNTRELNLQAVWPSGTATTTRTLKLYLTNLFGT